MTFVAIMIAFREEKPTRQRIVGLLTGFVGMVIVVGVWNPVPSGESSSLLGIGALLLAVCCYGSAFPFARRYLSGTRDHAAPNPIALATGLMVGGLIVTGPVVAITGLTRDGSVSGPSFWSLVALGALGSGIAYVLNFVLVQRSDATTASTVTFLTPLVAIIVGALVLGERITWNEPIGGVLVVVRAAIAQAVLWRGRPARAG